MHKLCNVQTVWEMTEILLHINLIYVGFFIIEF